ncbi:hypothetical protein C2G38_2202706 [Gigaspora rosea]|uniref:Uncharacterized protein n=1 Tax=Gigaspora rosea TaxID=44941 RepID=A0A397UQV9_9GLOM|nr:hypothetical protein C2G38_2202706 [Gigaspora rosea]
MEHAILIAIIDKIIPILEEYDIVLDIAIDSDLDSNKTLSNQTIQTMFVGSVLNNKLWNIIANHLRNKHNNCWPEVCWVVKNPDSELYNDIQYKDLEEFL